MPKIERWYEWTFLTRFNPALAGLAITLGWVLVGVLIGRWLYS